MVVIASGLIVLGMIAWQALPLGAWLEAAIAAVVQWGWRGQVAFVVAYALAVVVFAPATPFTVALGALYGYWGIGLSLAGALAGAVLSFLLARSSLRAPFLHLCTQRRLALALDRAVGSLGWKGVLLVRLSPVFPFSLQNYLLGMTGVSLLGFALASLVGMVPATLVKVWLGMAGAAFGNRVSGVVMEASGPFDFTSAPAIALVLTGLVATVMLTLLIVRRARGEGAVLQAVREAEGSVPRE